MVYLGLFYAGDYPDANPIQSFSGTKFYLDTKLALRYLGYSLSTKVDAAKELIDGKIKASNGLICLFEHTVQEIESALSLAAEKLRSNNITKMDTELYMFSTISKFTPNDFNLAAKHLRNTLKDSYNIQTQAYDYEEKAEHFKYTAEWNDLFKFIKESHKWKEKTIENDVKSIKAMNIMRSGNYNGEPVGRFSWSIRYNILILTVISGFISQENRPCGLFPAAFASKGSEHGGTVLLAYEP